MSENTVWNGHKFVAGTPVTPETPPPEPDPEPETESEDVTETNPATA